MAFLIIIVTCIEIYQTLVVLVSVRKLGQKTIAA